MEKEFKEYEDHQEIREGRGWLPAWWIYLLYITAAFSVGYVVYYHMAQDWTQESQYQADVKASEMAQASNLPTGLDAAGRNPLVGDAEAIAAGTRHFTSICAACHKPDATGLIGPNLTDTEFLHGQADAQIFHTIMEGVSIGFKQNPPKGPMPAHKASLGGTKVLQVMAFLATKNPAMEQKPPAALPANP